VTALLGYLASLAFCVGLFAVLLARYGRRLDR
jgi:hypothetical protein